MKSVKLASITIALLLSSVTAHADLSISNKPTKNMSCTAGVCTATAPKAVLNAGDLQSMLASGDAAVKTGSVTNNINIDQPLTWSNTSRLTLDAQQSVVFKKAATVTGTGALTITTNDGGSDGDYVFRGEGHVEFWDVASRLIINGKSFKLVSDIAALSSAVAKNPAGRYALAKNYNAALDGTYSQAPVVPDFRGAFEGLGNNISGLSIDDEVDGSSIGLFAVLSSGLIRDIGLPKIRIKAGNLSHVGGLAGQSLGTIANSFVTGSIKAGDGDGMSGNVGALAGYSTVSIAGSHAAVSLDVGAQQIVGGLAGENAGTISDSYATGAVKAAGSAYVGGFVGINNYSSTIIRCHATGDVAGGKEPIVGGFVGGNFGAISQSYALGYIVKAGLGGSEGGFSGFNVSRGTITQSYSRGDSFGSGGNKNFDDATGGFMGYNLGAVTLSYSTGTVSSGAKGNSFVGGLIGADGATPGNLANTYWDLDTSGVSDPSQGAGDPPNDPGITGLTSPQFKSALPAGFDPKVWGQDAKINNGYPYLLANPPPKGQ